MMQFNGDLSGRVDTINADKWTPAQLREVIASGERILNVKFEASFKDQLIRSCFESVFVVQEACLLACQNAKVFDKQILPRVVEVRNEAAIIADVVNRQSARFSDFIINFATGFGDTDLQMYRWVLAAILTADTDILEKGFHYRAIRRQLELIHPRGSALNSGNVTQALKSAASLQVQQGVKPLVLDYDQSLRTINIVDKSFLVWLAQQDREELLELIDVPTSILTAVSSSQPRLELP